MLFSPYYFGEPLFYMDWKPILDKSDSISLRNNGKRKSPLIFMERALVSICLIVFIICD
jgi:hypothetical protein